MNIVLILLITLIFALLISLFAQRREESRVLPIINKGIVAEPETHFRTRTVVNQLYFEIDNKVVPVNVTESFFNDVSIGESFRVSYVKYKIFGFIENTRILEK